MQTTTPSNTIVERVAVDLGKYPPFDRLGADKNREIAASLLVEYHEEGEMLFRKGDELGGFSYMVMKGAVRLFDTIDGEEMLVDLCDEGDLFGVRAIFGTSTYLLSAQVVEESLLLAIPVETIKALVQSEPVVAAFFTGAIARSVQHIEHSLSEAIDLRKSGSDAGIRSLLANDALVVDQVRNVITCAPDIPIREAARIMSDNNIGSIIVASANRHPLGIITDTDLRKKVVAVAGPVNERPVSDIMTSPVYTITAGKTVADMMMLMVRAKLRHFCITEDGTANSPVTGIISEHDIVTSEGVNPAVLMKAITQSESVEQLVQEREKAEKLLRMYIAQEVAIHFITSIFTELNDALIVKAIEFSVADMKREGIELPAVEFCWLSLGSEGRKEQLLRTDQDNAILFRDPPDEVSRDSVQRAFLELGKRVSAILVACGFTPCPAEIMASNPDWCQPLSGWMSYFRKWIGTPEPKALMNSTIFFDFRPVFGSTSLALEMKREINAEIERGRGFLQFFAKNALQNPPPLGFFRNFLVEKSREHAHEFDIKARAMMPLSDAARVLACEFGVNDFLGTVERFRRIGQLLPSFRELSEEAAQAYEFLMRLRTERGLAENSSGRYIDPEHLNKMQRQELRNLFTTIGQIQSMLNLRYQLDYIRA
ncbi:CBS domain-containing protein [Chlorobaculum sp. 24CR]|uniref:DUF294 nucleotidyltransferase-like domain-containing protein n=1 Tax=Chlorobaculum sp. 24CR TaxID=2508878 RepID=UPI00100C114F|nr:DUF294 nucleotidyltransferase-like domain-containing protein [Chlorobaculum sp. 24CR]RXK85178.1 CBS domain-containing protein [Chlorobaculum sp. 24CR]